MNNIESFKSYFSSEIILLVGVIGLFFLALRKKTSTTQKAEIFSLAILVFSLVAAISTHFDKGLALFHGMIALDAFGQFFKIIILAASLMTVVLSTQARDLERSPKVEFYGFLLTLTLGLNMMCAASDLLMMYLSLEMASLTSYIMAGYMAESRRSEESGLKYVLYGGVASGVMIFGLSLLYGLSGSLNLIEIREFFLNNPTDRLVLFITFIMILTGLGYKMAIAPFHMWSPDVYEGAPLPVTAFLSVGSKAAGFAMTLRFFYAAFIEVDGNGVWQALKALDWQFLMAVLSAVTMTVGNILAMQQHNIKRFLAYSSVAHAGYMLMGVAGQSRMGMESVMFYFTVYFLMNLGAFFVATLIANQFGTEEMADYKGLVRQNVFGTFLALCLSVFLFSLIGLPPFAGFVGKWYLFSATLDAGLVWLAVVAALNSVIALYYYVRLIKYMMFDPPAAEMKPVHSSWRYSGAIAAFAFFTLLFGVFFRPLAQWAQASAHMLY